MDTLKLPININDLLTSTTVESERIEYKEGWNPESIIHTICAFANDFHNLGGGYIIVGVSEEDGVPTLPPLGISIAKIDAIKKELLNLGNSAISPPYHPITATYEINSKHILVIWVPGGGSRPYQAKSSLSNKHPDWAYYIRLHSSTVKAKGQFFQELMSLTATIPFDDKCCQTASINDLSTRLIKDFLIEVKSELSVSAQTKDIETLARQMNIVDGPNERLFPKNVGLLFFNEHPYKFFPVTQIDIVYFPDGAGGEIFEEKIFKGPLGEILKNALNFIKNNYLKEIIVKHDDRPESSRHWNFPFAAIEEAIVNAIYHRSYEIREPVEVRIDKFELAVLSFPGPCRSVDLSMLSQGKAISRRYRNRRIGEFLKELELTEGRSTGIPKILRAMKINDSPKPVFETDEDRSYFLIKLPVHNLFLREHNDKDLIHLNPEKAQSGAEKAQSGVEKAQSGVEKAQSGAEKAQSGVEKAQSGAEKAQSEFIPIIKIPEPIRENLQLSNLLTLIATFSPISAGELVLKLGLSEKHGSFKRNLTFLLKQGFIEYQYPEKPNSRNQKYLITDLGHLIIKSLQRQ